MAQLTCSFCKTLAVENAIFCYQCGNQLRCKTCQEELLEHANNCIACGTPVVENAGTKKVILNSIRFKENKEERSYELEFTNDVGKEIKEVVADLLKNKLGQSAELSISIQQLQDEQISFTETASKPQEKMEYINASVAPEILPTQEYPHIDDLEFNLQCRENEWLLIFAFYISEYGTKFFSKNAVWEIYKQKRNTETRFKNLGTNWRSLFKKYISTVKENEFKITPSGLEKVKSLLSGTLKTKKEAKVKKRKITNPEVSITNFRTMAAAVPRKVVANSIMQEEFDAYKNSYKESLESFFTRKKPGTSTPNRLVTMGYYITKINGQDYFTEGHIDFAFRLLNLSGKPIHLTQVITNLKNERVWFQRVKQGDILGWRLTRQAEIYVEEKLPPTI